MITAGREVSVEGQGSASGYFSKARGEYRGPGQRKCPYWVGKERCHRVEAPGQRKRPRPSSQQPLSPTRGIGHVCWCNQI
jgi:hypothetical protein